MLQGNTFTYYKSRWRGKLLKKGKRGRIWLSVFTESQRVSCICHFAEMSLILLVKMHLFSNCLFVQQVEPQLQHHQVFNLSSVS